MNKAKPKHFHLFKFQRKEKIVKICNRFKNILEVSSLIQAASKYISKKIDQQQQIKFTLTEMESVHITLCDILKFSKIIRSHLR